MSAVTYQRDVTPEVVGAGRARYLTNTDHLMMVVLDCTDGPNEQPDPPHHHPHEQVTYIVAGDVIFFLDGEPLTLTAGDMIAVPPHVPHCIQPLSAHVRLIDTFTPIRDEFLR